MKKIRIIGYGAEVFKRCPETQVELLPRRQLADNSCSPYKFAYSRTAFKYGLKAVGFSSGDGILVPGFICESAIEPMVELGISPRYYPIDSELKPEWNALDELVDSSIKALLIVHYFGQPQSIEDCRNFCDKYSLKLIEDNAHGFGAEINGQLLGTFGDIGFSSPRKSFPVRNGAYLYLSDNKDVGISGLKPTSDSSMAGNNSLKSKLKNAFIMQGMLNQKRMIREYVERRNGFPDYGSQKSFRNSNIKTDYGMDEVNEIYLSDQDIRRIRNIRCEIYELWHIWAVKKGLKPVFSSLKSGTVPLVFPAYSESAEESIALYERGHRMGVDIHSWPTLPLDIVEQNGLEMRQWERLVCFPIHQNMDIKALKKRISQL